MRPSLQADTLLLAPFWRQEEGEGREEGRRVGSSVKTNGHQPDRTGRREGRHRTCAEMGQATDSDTPPPAGGGLLEWEKGAVHDR